MPAMPRKRCLALSRDLSQPAGFHSAALYPALRDAVGPLVALLRDNDCKTRANAAGALGNLVRNSPLLTHDLLRARTLQAWPISLAD